jgi:hypothetical protein
MTSVLVVGLATPLLSALALLPIYALARQQGGVRAGLRAAGIFALVPAFTLFAPQMDQLFPLLAGLILWAFITGWEKQHPGWLFISGLLLSLATFLSLGLAALGLWLSLYAVIRWLTDSPGRTWQRLVATGLAVGAGIASLWLICWLTFGLDPLAVVRTGMAQHFEIVTGRRDYGLWLGYNFYDFASFLGLPLAFLFSSRVLTGFRHAAGRRWHKVDAVAVATALTLLILDLSGTSRGEVARLWLFLMPPAVLAAVTPLNNGQLLKTLALLQAVSLLTFGLFLDVVPIVPLPTLERTRSAQLPLQHQVRTTFGDQIELLGYDLTSSAIRPGETFAITLHWRALVEPQQSYKVFIHLLDPAGILRAQADGVPVNWTLPTTCWVRGETITDPYTLTLPLNAPPGDYTLSLGFYDKATKGRLRVGEEDHLRLKLMVVPTSP